MNIKDFKTVQSLMSEREKLSHLIEKCDELVITYQHAAMPNDLRVFHHPMLRDRLHEGMIDAIECINGELSDLGVNLNEDEGDE